MTALTKLLADCDAHSIQMIPATDGGLTIDAPQGALTPDLIDRMKAHKCELLAILQVNAVGPSTVPTNARAVWQAALIRLERDPQFLPEVMEAVQLADVHWATDETPGEPADDSAPEAIDPDGWPSDSLNPDDLEPCPKCRTLELWQTLAGVWRCLRCDPPIVARRVLALAEQIRRRKNRIHHGGIKEQYRD